MWFLLSACQGPFEHDRHDLVGFRVAAIAAPPTATGGRFVPHVALVVDGRPWADSRVDLRWYWLSTSADPADAVAALDPAEPPDAQGPDPLLTVPDDRRTLALIALHVDQSWRGFLEIPAPTDAWSPPTGIALGSLDLTVRGAEPADLQLEARRKLPSEPAESVPAGGFGRLAAEGSGDPLVRWMATRGTFFELDRHTADWAAGDLVLDGDEISDGRTTLDPGPVTVVALALGDHGQTAFLATDLYVGDPPPGLWVQGRYLPTAVPVDWKPGDSVRGTLVADDASPTGLTLADPAVERDVVDWGTADLACARPLDGPFDPGWLLTGVCARSAVDGAEVVVVPERTR